MSEMNNASAMYEVEKVKGLNYVEGFDPRRFMRQIQKEGQPMKLYLDVAYRKLWFRLCYPQGKIVKKLLKLTEQVAIVEARVYLHHDDPEDHFIANALAQKYMTEDEQFGSKFVELAETAAVGRALSDAGFGLQFADQEGDFDPEVTEAPLESQILSSAGSALSAGAYIDETAMDEAGEEIAPEEDDSIPGQYNIEEYIPTPEEVGQAIEQGMTMAPEAGQSAVQPPQGNAPVNTGRQTAGAKPAPAARQTKAPASGPKPVPAAANSKPAAEIRTDMPVEQIYALLNRDIAADVVVPVGFNKGKKLGQVAQEKPANLEWYVNSYEGPNNLLRAAAKFLIDTALEMAS